MTWDYAELNTLLAGTGSFLGAVEWTAESIDGVAAGTDRQLVPVPTLMQAIRS